jgi:hypothetical protein
LIPSENFLITDIHRANIQIYPRVFRCTKCNSLTYISSDRHIGDQVSQNHPPPAKVGISCPVCNSRPMTQQPHILIDYDSGREFQLQTKCKNDHALKLKFTGSVVSILGWRLSCNEPTCEYSVFRDPFAKKTTGQPYFPFFYHDNKRLAITPATRGPRQPIVITKVDTMKFPFKPNESLLAALFNVNNCPSINELFNEWCKIRNSLIHEFKEYIDDKKDRIKKAEKSKPGDKLYDSSEENLLKNDEKFKEISEKTDGAGNQLKKMLIEAKIDTSIIDSYLQDLRFDFDEIINLLISNGKTYEEFLNELNEEDNRKNNLTKFNENLKNLNIDFIKYLYNDDPKDIENEPNRSLQIVKVGIGTKISEQNIPFHMINNTQYDAVMDYTENRMRPDQNHPIIFGTNHPIEALFIKFDPKALVTNCNVSKKSNNNNINLALIEDEITYQKIETLLHTISHLLIRRISQISGLGLGSLSHRIFPKAGSILLYTTVFPTLGQLREVFEYNIMELTNPLKIKRQASKCPRDPICLENEFDPANCFACLHIPDHCCDGFWNRKLDRRAVWNNEGSGLWNH